jgi:hypothetical protein
MLELLADTSNTAVTEVSNGMAGGVGALLGMGGGVGFAIWYGYYMTTVAIPKIIASNAENVEKISGRHDATIKQIHEELRADRREDRAVLAALSERIGGLPCTDYKPGHGSVVA